MNIYHIANEAGVSIATVSRVINGTGPVSEATRRRVLEVVERHDYRPNLLAQGLTTSKTHMIGVLTTSISDTYFNTAIYILEQNAKKNGYDILLSFSDGSPEDTDRQIALLTERFVDGIILIGSVFSGEATQSIAQAAKSLPIVTLNALIPSPGIYSVCCDDEAGGYAATGYLIGLHAERIAYIYGNEKYSNVCKKRGYERAMSENGLPAQIFRIEGDIQQGCDKIDALLTDHSFDGMFCSEDMLAVSALKALRSRGISVPNETAVIGYDNLLLSQCTHPELASVDSKVRLMSNYAFETMMKVLESGMASERIFITPELVIRESANK